MKKYFIDFMESERQPQRKRCILQFILQILPIVTGFMAYGSNGVSLVIWGICSAIISFVTIRRGFVRDSLERNYILQIVEMVTYVAMFTLVGIAMYAIQPTATLQLYGALMLAPFARSGFREVWECRQCGRWLSLNDRYYERDFDRFLYRDYRRRYGLIIPAVLLGVEIAGVAFIVVFHSDDWGSRQYSILSYIGLACCALAEPSIIVTVAKLRWLRLVNHG